MEGATTSRKLESQSIKVAAPKDYFLGPVFAASKQTGPARRIHRLVQVHRDMKPIQHMQRLADPGLF
jgi:hypothetical protein